MLKDIWYRITASVAVWLQQKPAQELPAPCLVCGYKHVNNLNWYPADYNICGRCGTEFGYDDFSWMHRDIWRRWVDRDSQWFDPKEEQANALRHG